MVKPKDILRGLVVVSVLIWGGAVLHARFLPWWAQGLSFAVMAGLGFLTLRQKRRWIQILVVIGLVLSSWRLITFQNGLDALVAYEDEEVRTMVFLVAAERSETTLKGLSGITLGISEGINEDTRKALEEEVDENADAVTWKLYAGDQAVYQALLAEEIDVMVMDSSSDELLIESDKQFSTKTRLIWEVHMSYLKEVILKDINVSRQPFIVYISGIDVVGEVSKRQRSDVNLLLIVNPLTYSIVMLPIARDAYLPLGCENQAMDKLTHAGLYGVSCSVKTIENFLDIDINYYVRLNFTSFLNLIDVLGSITVYSSQTFTSTYFGPKRPSYDFVKGMNVMDSKKALAFARERFVFEEGDVMRGRNQTELIKGIANKLMEVQTLTKIDAILETVRTSIDTNFPAERLNEIIRLQLDQNPRWNLIPLILKYEEDFQPAYSYGPVPLFVVHPTPDSVESAKAAIADQLEIILP